MRLVFDKVVMMRCDQVTTWWRGNIGAPNTLERCEIGL
jgi:hypothetical protein